MNNKGADQTARMCRLICAFIVSIWHKQVFSWRGSFSLQTIVGTDVADLLLEGHEPTTLDYRQTGMKIAPSLDTLEGDDDGDVDQSVVSDRSSVNKTKSVEEVTDRFRHLLLYGRKKVGHWLAGEEKWQYRTMGCLGQVLPISVEGNGKQILMFSLLFNRQYYSKILYNSD